MSLCVGLGASQADLDVQGEIDFDFFEESESGNNAGNIHPTQDASLNIQPSCESESFVNNSDMIPKESDLNVMNILESSPGNYFNKPVITVSCDNVTGLVQKTMIEAIIPSPFEYKDNKCGNISRKNKKMSSPRLKTKIFNEDPELSDDSLSSMSESESDLSSISDDSFNLNEDTDSMTDVTPLMSPYQCYSPMPGRSIGKSCSNKTSVSNLVKNEGVKLSGNQECSKCEAIDINELLKAVKHLEVGQNINSVSKQNCSPPSVVTQNVRCRKNISFSNEEVKRIDNDNHVLLKKINAQRNRNKPCTSVPVRVISSASVNRQKNQRLIEVENLALLKRLESTKASKELRRSFLLKEYECRSAGVLSRTSSRATKTGSSRISVISSGRSSAVSSKSSIPSASSNRTSKS